LERSSDRIQKAESLGWTIRSFNSAGLEEELRECHRITHSAFEGALGYTPVPEALFVGLYAPLIAQVPSELLLVAVDENGRVGGYCLCFPDLSSPENRRFVVKSLAIDPSAQRASLGTALLAVAHRRALAMGLSGGSIYALMHADAHSIAISEKAGGVIFRRYGLFEKLL
jgi:GNAT superfamily N-acetyltransferase